MVALATNTSETSPWDVLDGFPKLHSRARDDFTSTCTEAPHSKLFGRVEIWLTIYDCRGGLESFTRDPIGYEDLEASLYHFVYGRVTVLVDPSGLTPVPGDTIIGTPTTPSPITTGPIWPSKPWNVRFPRVKGVGSGFGSKRVARLEPA